MKPLVPRNYDHIAKVYGLSPTSTMKDQYIRDCEVHYFCDMMLSIKKFRSSLRILDVGCGNGYLVEKLARLMPESQFTGLDLSREMIEVACTRKIRNATFVCGSITDDLSLTGDFDVILSERCLVNLLSKKQQHKALQVIARRLAPKGFFILSESFRREFDNLNRARKEFLLEPLSPSEFNLFLGTSVGKKLSKLGLVECIDLERTHTLSTHFFVTRVLHPALRPKGAKVRHTEFVKFFNMALPVGIGEYSPILFKLWKKI